MLRNKSPSSSLPTGSTAASIKSEYDSEDYVTLLIARKLLVFKSFGSIYSPVDQKYIDLVTFRRVYSFLQQHFITLIRKSYFDESF